jgi:hypothetical protein
MTSSKRWKSVRAAQVVVAVASILVSGTIWYTFAGSRSSAGFEWVNHDVGNILYIGQHMLRGERLYADLAEANPPGIFFVAELVAAVARWTGFSPIALFHGLVVLLGLSGVALIQSLYARANRPVELVLSCCAFLLILSGGGSIGDRSLADSFGQREQLFALGFVPYLLWRISRQPLSKPAYFWSALVGWFASLKPHFAVLVVALELCCLPRDRATIRRVGPVLIAGAVLPYALLPLHSPNSLAALWNETIPLHTRGAYSYFNQPYALFLHSTQHLWVLAYAVAIIYFLWSGAQPSQTLLLVLCVLPGLAYALVVQQHKFWNYHAIVLIAVLVVFAYLVGAKLVVRLPRERSAPLFALLLGAVAVQNGFGLAELRALSKDWKNGLGVDARLVKIAPLLAGRQRVLYYSTSIAHMRLALLLGQRSVGHWNHEISYPSLVRDPDPQRRARSLERYCAEQRRLIAVEKPHAIVFHSARQGLTSAAEELLPLLVERCHVVPQEDYTRHAIAGISEATVFLRRSDERARDAKN